jgi:uncharacterized protein (TIGR02246 family)
MSGTMTPTQDELAVRTLVDGLVAGWNAHDGTAFARQFAVDADFTNVMGLHAKGRDVIARGHDEIFATMFKGTTLTATVEQIRFLRPDVAVASVVLVLRQKDGTPWGAFPRSLASLIAVRDAESWSIAVFRNMVPFQRPAAGPVERSLAATPRSAS